MTGQRHEENGWSVTSQSQNSQGNALPCPGLLKQGRYAASGFYTSHQRQASNGWLFQPSTAKCEYKPTSREKHLQEELVLNLKKPGKGLFRHSALLSLKTQYFLKIGHFSI